MVDDGQARTIVKVRAREIVDSRGNPTLEVDVHLDDGTVGRAAVPSGASTGAAEAKELRDGDPTRFAGRGVLSAAQNIRGEIGDCLCGLPLRFQREIDERLVDLDGTPDKSRLGANAVLAASMSTACALAKSSDLSLYEYLGEDGRRVLPVPLMNILNGGEHADNNVDVQEFMIVPAGAECFSEALRWGCEVYHALGGELARRRLGSGVGDEGGYAPDLDDDEEALDLVLEAVELAGYRPGEQIWLALDVAASELRDDAGYGLRGDVVSAEGLTEMYARWCDQYPIISIEDGMAEDDWAGWQYMTAQLGDRVQLVGDDLFVTDVKLLERGVKLGAGNAILIKPNQIGTVTETLDAIQMAERVDYGICVSHRSGETADTFIADLSVARGCGQLKSGAPCRSERVEKYNRLLRIEEGLDGAAEFARTGPFVLK